MWTIAFGIVLSVALLWLGFIGILLLKATWYATTEYLSKHRGLRAFLAATAVAAVLLAVGLLVNLHH